MLKKGKIQQTIETNVKKYIHDNVYLFRTDTEYEAQCRLKPRIIYQAIETACGKCKDMGLVKADDYQACNDLFELAMDYANYQMEVITRLHGEKEKQKTFKMVKGKIIKNNLNL